MIKQTRIARYSKEEVSIIIRNLDFNRRFIENIVLLLRNIHGRTINLAEDNICNAFRTIRICQRCFPAGIKGTHVFLD